MTEYKIHQKTAREIAVGLYRQIGTYISAARQSNPDDYERFQTEYVASQANTLTKGVSRRNIRNSQTKSASSP